jgi:hypothetical protein
MISIVLYGRNDSYGYNLHKRAALALNCMAEVLSDPADEILFVDYNSPDDHPTFPEAIADTLTDKVVERLRILRVRSSIHERVAGRTHLLAIEPIARNVAVRRSNPSNRWILSTNTDMIFVPRRRASLSEIAGGLADGFYHLPRFEIPESLWEGFDRRNPRGVIAQVAELGRTMFLNEIVFGGDFIKYDGPGDFQLMLRRDLFSIDGFNEEMLLGWHVDSNIAKRLHLLHGVVGDVIDDLFGYHCDHTRQVTPAHKHRAASNDSRVFVEDVTHPSLPAQAASWGCADDEIEEIRLGRSSHHVYMHSLRGVLTGEWAAPAQAHYTPASFDQVTYDARHVLPFVADLLSSAPRQWTIGWVGGRVDTFQLFCQVWDRLGFAGRILIPEWSSPLLLSGAPATVNVVDLAHLGAAADVVLMDFGEPTHASEPKAHPVDPRVDKAVAALMRRSFADLVLMERTRLAAQVPPRRFICLNAIHTAAETMVLEEIAAASTPFASRMRHGFVKPRSESYAETLPTPRDTPAPVAPPLLDAMCLGDSGRRVEHGILAPFGDRGIVLHGPHRPLPAGTYRFDIEVRAHSGWSLAAAIRPIIVEVAAGEERLLQRRCRFLLRSTLQVTFSVPDRVGFEQPIYLRVFRGRFVDFVIIGIALVRLGDTDDSDEKRANELKRLLDSHPEPSQAT